LCGLPVVAFRDAAVAVEMLEDGVSGFLVDTEEAALRYLDKLAAEPEFRFAIGREAERRVQDVMGKQEQCLRRFYLGD
jgi:glycosyltransferase involved in cell wall biosynthesis